MVELSFALNTLCLCVGSVVSYFNSIVRISSPASKNLLSFVHLIDDDMQSSGQEYLEKEQKVEKMRVEQSWVVDLSAKSLCQIEKTRISKSIGSSFHKKVRKNHRSSKKNYLQASNPSVGPPSVKENEIAILEENIFSLDQSITYGRILSYAENRKKEVPDSQIEAPLKASIFSPSVKIVSFAGISLPSNTRTNITHIDLNSHGQYLPATMANVSTVSPHLTSGKIINAHESVLESHKYASPFSPEVALSPEKSELCKALANSQKLADDDTDFLPRTMRSKILSREKIPNSTSINSNTFEQNKYQG